MGIVLKQVKVELTRLVDFSENYKQEREIIIPMRKI
jgi:hypothetical protein